MNTLANLILAASGLGGSTYGWGELRCGDIGQARACTEEAITASGLPLGVALPIVALAIPTNMRLRGTHWVSLSIDGGKTCAVVLLADKKNERYAKSQPWDFSPRALAALGVTSPSRTWSTPEVTVCNSQRHEQRELVVGVE